MFLSNGQFIIAWILYGSMATPIMVITWLRYSNWELPKTHLLLLAKRLWLLSISNTICNYSTCFFNAGLYTKMSSKKTSMNFCKWLLNMSFIKLCKVAGALVKLNGMTKNSLWPLYVLKVVLCTSSASILIWWYPTRKSTFEKYNSSY